MFGHLSQFLFAVFKQGFGIAAAFAEQGAEVNMSDARQCRVRFHFSPYGLAAQRDKFILYGLFQMNQGMGIARCPQAQFCNMPDEITDVQPGAPGTVQIEVDQIEAGIVCDNLIGIKIPMYAADLAGWQHRSELFRRLQQIVDS